jgi:hypothetical protein
MYDMGQAAKIENDLEKTGISTYRGVAIYKNMSGKGCVINMAPTLQNPEGKPITCADAREAISKINSSSLLQFQRTES